MRHQLKNINDGLLIVNTVGTLIILGSMIVGATTIGYIFAQL